MFENTIDVPVYLITGFLESGKTSFLKFTISQDYFQIDGTTLLLLCEEGEEEYDEAELRRCHTVVETLSEPEDLNYQTLRALQRKHRPERVIIEFNSFWSVSALQEMRMPRGWGIVQDIVLADAETFQVYLNNMKSLFVEMVRPADMVLFNRCEEGQPLANFRRSIKVVNPACDVQFMDKKRRPMDIFSDTVPFDLDKEIIEIEDVDYGIFFVDMRDHPDRYEGKKVRFKGQVLKSREAGADFFVPARSAMTCCADDIQYIGYLCKSKDAPRLPEGKWVEVTARVDWKFVPMAQEEQPVLQAITVKETAAPDPELVYFN